MLTLHHKENCELISFYELPLDVQEERKNDYDSIIESSFFLYRGHYYDLNSFTRLDGKGPEKFRPFDAYLSETFFSGILIKYNDEYESVMVESYYS